MRQAADLYVYRIACFYGARAPSGAAACGLGRVCTPTAPCTPLLPVWRVGWARHIVPPLHARSWPCPAPPTGTRCTHVRAGLLRTVDANFLLVAIVRQSSRIESLKTTSGGLGHFFKLGACRVGGWWAACLAERGDTRKRGREAGGTRQL